MSLFETLLQYYQTAESELDEDIAYVTDQELHAHTVFVCGNIKSKAPIRFLLACLAAKTELPHIDIRKPYTSIPGNNHFSGRKYDETVIQQLVTECNLPCNSTTAFLTPVFRNCNQIMEPGLKLEGRPPELYTKMLLLLNAVHRHLLSPQVLITEILRQLIVVRDRQTRRINELLENLKPDTGELPLSSEQVITLLLQHLACKGSSRLPTLMVAAAYKSAEALLQERALPLKAHNAADKQTGATADVEITLLNHEKVVTCYEMKDKAVTTYDIDLGMSKIVGLTFLPNNYIFITTEPVQEQVSRYAKSVYNKIGVEFAVLDCIGFLRHFLHFFHRSRASFLEEYQTLLLSQPDSAVSQPLKEAFLSLRQAAEAGD